MGLDPGGVAYIAEQLNVPEADVVSMNRLAGRIIPSMRLA